jgi:transcriptional regulator with PAS, ATPase and Fis domain
MGHDSPTLNDEAVDWLREYAFPGNVRELKSIIERDLIENGGNVIGEHHLRLLSFNTDAT